MRDTQRIQMVQNSCIRYSYGIRKFDHLSGSFTDSGWMNMRQRWILHFLILVHSVLLTGKPTYLRDKLHYCHEFHQYTQFVLRDPYKLSLPRHSTTRFENSFSYLAPKLHNEVPRNLKSLSLDVFYTEIRDYVRNTY